MMGLKNRQGLIFSDSTLSDGRGHHSGSVNRLDLCRIGRIGATLG